MDARNLIERSNKSLEIGAKLETARIFAVCADGSVYLLEDMVVKPPIKALEVDVDILVAKLQIRSR